MYTAISQKRSLAANITFGGVVPLLFYRLSLMRLMTREQFVMFNRTYVYYYAYEKVDYTLVVLTLAAVVLAGRPGGGTESHLNPKEKSAPL